MYKALTNTGKEFIHKICDGNNDLLRGNNGPLPFSDDGDGKSIDQTWVVRAFYVQDDGSSTNITSNNLGSALINWFNKYAEMYDLDANILAAQAYVESGYKIWFYSNKTTASGINQFTMEMVYGVIVNNFSDVQPVMWTKSDGINSAFLKITDGLTSELSLSSYQPNQGNEDSKKLARVNRGILHQNIINNPEVMIKAQARYMKYFANNCNNLASTSLFCYKLGSAFVASTYSRAIDLFKKAKGITSDSDPKLKEGLTYVLKTFGVLGDKNNGLQIASLDKNYKPNGYYFGYDTLFNASTENTDDVRKNNNNSNQKSADLITYPNENFSPYNANTIESDEYGIPTAELDNLTISSSPQYKFIYFPEDQYIKESTNKLQIVLHHTVSGSGKDGVTGDIRWWLSKGERVATAFIISREGGIYQLFNTNYWAHHLGITADFIKEQGTSQSNNFLNSRSIGIEIDSWGGLIKANDGNWYPTIMDADGNLQSFEPRKNATYVPIGEVQQYNSSNGYPKGFRGFFGFEKYTTEQIDSVRNLILSLKNKFGNIDITYKSDMWDLANKSTGCWGVSKNALNGVSGVWTHVSYRNDKSDCHPQPDLITMLQELSEGKTNKSFNKNFEKSERNI